MIVLTFKIGTVLLKAKIKDKEVYMSGGIFYNSFIPMNTVISVSLTKDLLKEHPDLIGKTIGEMRSIARERWREKIENMNSEEEIKKYVIEEMGKKGGILVKEENDLH